MTIGFVKFQNRITDTPVIPPIGSIVDCILQQYNPRDTPGGGGIFEVSTEVQLLGIDRQGIVTICVLGTGELRHVHWGWIEEAGE